MLVHQSLSSPHMMSGGDVVMLSPSRKRATPDGGLDTSTTPHKIAKLETAESRTHTTPIRQTTEPTAPQSAASSALSDAIASRQPSTIPTPTKNTTKTAPKRKRTREEIEAERIIKETEKAQREADKQAKLLEKEEKRRKKEEDDKVKEEERRLKEEERKKKQAERDDKKLQKDQERIAKESEKQKKLDEQKKKDNAQLKLKSFFTAKSSPSLPKSASGNLPDNASLSKAATVHASTDYSTTFLPFNVPKHSTLAPINLHTSHPDYEETLISLTDIMSDRLEARTLSETLGFPIREQQDESHTITELVDIIHGTVNHPIDLTSQEYGRTIQEALEKLNDNLSYLEFFEDVRPPFCGAFTKKVSPAELRRVKRQPCQIKVEALIYDYDSEAEWEEPEEGEDIGDDDDDESDDGDDDMDGFIDDEANAHLGKRPAYIRDLPPISSGLQWQDAKGELRAADLSTSKVDWTELEMCFLLAPEPTCVNPFSHQYWEPAKDVSAAKSTVLNTAIVQRQALKDKTHQINGVAASGPSVFKVLSTIAPEYLDAFKEKIEGKIMTKIAMREYLKQEFPKFKKEDISNTLDAVAEREGKKPTAKWRLK